MYSRKPKVIAFTLYGPTGASSYYRILQYVEELSNDMNIDVKSFWPENYSKKYMSHKRKYAIIIGIIYVYELVHRIIQLLFLAPRYDVIIIQKGLIPKVKNTYLKRVLNNDLKIVFDVDDAVYLNRYDNSDDIARVADVVLVGSERLYKHYNKLAKRTIIVPTVDNDALYRPLRKNTFDSKIIGWIGNNVNLNNIEMLVEPINNLIDRHPEVSFMIISDDDGGYCQKIRNSSLKKWSKETYLHDLSEISIGVMPLIDNRFNEGKCAFKLIQYMMMEKPVLGSPIGENKLVLSYGGDTAINENEWEVKLEKMLYDEQKYDACVKRIQNVFQSEFCFQRVLETLKKELLVNYV